MAILASALITELQYHLIEETATSEFSSAIWTKQEVLNYINKRQYQFLKETGLLLSWVDLPTTPANSRQPLPQDWIATQMVSWRGADGVTKDIPRDTTLQLDNLLYGWQTNLLATPPVVYTELDTPENLEIQITPTSLAGVLELLYVALSTLIDDVSDSITVPDEFLPAIKYGVLADMLGKTGKGFDETRANYCELRYQEGVNAAMAMLEAL